MDKQYLLDSLSHEKIIAAINIADETKVIPLIQAMVKGGIKWIEFTFRNEKTEDCLKKLQSAKLPVIYGAGTVRNLEQAQKAVDAGVQYLVAPGLNIKLLDWAADHNLLIFPGVDSTMGIETAIEHGIKTMKFFPAAELGGPKWIKAMAGPYFDIKFIPTGGVTLDNLGEYVKIPNVIAVGGTFLAPKEMIETEKYEDITAICQKATAIIKTAGGKS